MPNTRVLVIDDDAAVREAVREGLRQESYDLVFAENGAEALALLAEFVPRVIVLDLRMPVMDGLGFLSNVDLRAPDCPYSVVLLTAYADEESVKASYEAGVSALVKKPFTLSELRGALSSAVHLQANTRAIGQQLLGTVADVLVQEEFSKRLDTVGRYLDQMAQALDERGLPDLPEYPELEPSPDPDPASGNTGC